jgi:hypothetical protein
MAEIPFLADIDLGGVARVKNLPAPTAPNDAARLADVTASILTLGRAVAVCQNLPLM